MLWRLSARLVTGPAAFAVAGAMDLIGYAWARAKARRSPTGTDAGDAVEPAGP